MDKKDENCIFIGYKYGMKGYNIWNPITKKFVYSRCCVWKVKKIPHIGSDSNGKGTRDSIT